MYHPIKIEGDKVKINFSLFRNDNREKDTHPQAKSWDKETGLSASAWTRQTKTGDKYQSCVVEFPVDLIMEMLKQDLIKDQPKGHVASRDVNFDDDPLPF